VELEASKEILRERQQAYNARVERLEQRTRRLEAETLRLTSIKQDLKKRLWDIESSATWRLSGPCRRLQPMVGALIKARSDGARGDGDSGVP
jgi:hypothetical protein